MLFDTTKTTEQKVNTILMCCVLQEKVATNAKNILKCCDVWTITSLFWLQTGPAEARGFVHPAVGSSLQSEASEEQQPLSQQPSPQSRQLRWVYTSACGRPE